MGAAQQRPESQHKMAESQLVEPPEVSLDAEQNNKSSALPEHKRKSRENDHQFIMINAQYLHGIWQSQHNALLPRLRSSLEHWGCNRRLQCNRCRRQYTNTPGHPQVRCYSSCTTGVSTVSHAQQLCMFKLLEAGAVAQLKGTLHTLGLLSTTHQVSAQVWAGLSC